MSRFDTTRVTRLAIAGAIAGFIMFLLANPAAVRSEQDLPKLEVGFGVDPQTFDLDRFMKSCNQLIERLKEGDPLGAILFTGSFAGLLAGLLTAADQMGTSRKRIIIKTLYAVMCGILIGAITGVIVDFLVSRSARVNLLLVIPAQMLGWVFMGLGIGAGVGAGFGSRRRMLNCAFGGLLGGIAGVTLFESLGQVTQSGTMGRMIGFPVIGACIGAAVALIEEAARQSWVTVLTGSKEGRSYILAKPSSMIGRDELSDIPLFGDPNIQKHHAVLEMNGYMVILQGAPGAAVAVNGVPTSGIQLKNADMISIGRHTLRFNQKSRRAVRMTHPPFATPPAQHIPPQYSAAPGPYEHPQPAMMVPATGTLVLTIISGPNTGQSYRFTPGLIRIGREADCQVCLSNDVVISRHHAEIGWDGMNWHIRDAGSRNGLWVNGMRISRQMLSPTDQIAIGQTVMRVDGT